jgi:hypothetical protein
LKGEARHRRERERASKLFQRISIYQERCRPVFPTLPPLLELTTLAVVDWKTIRKEDFLAYLADFV